MPKVEAAEVGAEAEHVCCEAGEAVVSEVEGGEVRAGGQPGGRQVAQQVVGEDCVLGGGTGAVSFSWLSSEHLDTVSQRWTREVRDPRVFRGQLNLPEHFFPQIGLFLWSYFGTYNLR